MPKDMLTAAVEAHVERVYQDFEIDFKTVYMDNGETRRRLSTVRQFCAYLLHGTEPSQGTCKWPSSKD